MTATTIRPIAAQLSQSEGFCRSLLRAAATYHRRAQTRRQLESLGVEQLRDVGLDPDVISRGHRLPVDPWVVSRLQNLM